MKIYTEPDSLIVRFEGIEKFLAIKNQLVVKKSNIRLMKWHEVLYLSRSDLGWRVGGVSIPKLIMAGRFASGSGLNFVYLTNAKNIMALKSARLDSVLEIDCKDYRYQKLFFTYKDAESAAKIIHWSDVKETSTPKQT